MINVIDPARVYIGGEITLAWDLIEATVRAALAERALTPAAAATDIRPWPRPSIRACEAPPRWWRRRHSPRPSSPDTQRTNGPDMLITLGPTASSRTPRPAKAGPRRGTGPDRTRHLHYGRIILDADEAPVRFNTGERETGLICLAGAPR